MTQFPVTQILLVEDNRGDARLIEIYLSESDSLNGRLYHASSLHEALERLQHDSIEVVLLDLSLPDAQGIETFKTLHTAAPELPIIVLTGTNDEDLALRAMRYGAQDYIVKGEVEGTLLARAIRYAIERKRLENERRKLHDELLRKERMAAIGETVANVTHYIKNVLTRMVGSERMIDTMLSRGDTTKLLEVWPIFRRATYELNQYVHDMLNFSRDHPISADSHDVNDLVREVHDLCREDAARKSIQLQLELDSTVPEVWIDRAVLKDVLLNLVTNAMEALDEKSGGRIVLSTAWKRDCDCAQISVSDNGLGISREAMDRVFDPFFSTKGKNGTGLGLAMARKYIHAHHGHIYFTSEPGDTVFCILLPLGRVELDAAAADTLNNTTLQQT